MDKEIKENLKQFRLDNAGSGSDIIVNLIKLTIEQEEDEKKKEKKKLKEEIADIDLPGELDRIKKELIKINPAKTRDIFTDLDNKLDKAKTDDDRDDITLDFVKKWNKKEIANFKARNDIAKAIKDDAAPQEAAVARPTPRPSKRAPTPTTPITFEDQEKLEMKYLTGNGIPKYQMEIDDTMTNHISSQALEKFVISTYGSIIASARGRGGRNVQEKIIYHRYNSRVDVEAKFNPTRNMDIIEYSSLPFNLIESVGDRMIVRGTPRESPSSLLYAIFYCMSMTFRAIFSTDEQVNVVTDFRQRLHISLDDSSKFWSNLQERIGTTPLDDIFSRDFVDRFTDKGAFMKNKLRNYIIASGAGGTNKLTLDFVGIMAVLFDIDIYVLNLRTQKIEDNKIADNYTRILQANWRILAMEDGVLRDRPNEKFDPSQLYGTRPIIVLGYSNENESDWHRFMPIFHLHADPNKFKYLSYRQLHQYTFNPSDIYVAQLRTYYLKRKFNPFYSINTNTIGLYKVYFLSRLDTTSTTVTNKEPSKPFPAGKSIGYDDDSSPSMFQIFDLDEYKKGKLVYLGTLAASDSNKRSQLEKLHYSKLDLFRALNVYRQLLEDPTTSEADKRLYKEYIKKNLEYIAESDSKIKSVKSGITYEFSI